VSDEMVGVLEPSPSVEGRFRVASIDFELSSGWCIDVEFKGRWVSGSVEYSHRRSAYYFTEPLGPGELLNLAEIAARRLLVRLP
jgi:hypothetical protein